MSDQQAQPQPDSSTELDPYKLCQIARNADGTITRLGKIFPDVPANSSDPNLKVLSKDIPLNQSKNTWLRLFLSREALNDNSSSSSKLPLIVYFHGGGFVVLSAASSLFHDYCSNLAAAIPAVVVSVEYGLCPENRLPGPYEDAMDALRWIRAAEDEWLRERADLSNCFLMGDSAGGNIAYHAGLRAAAEAEALKPVVIRGMILNQASFGGVERTASEIRLVNHHMAPLCMCDMMWELSLPVGVDRDHEYSNPTAGGGSIELDLVRRQGCKVLVTGWDGDPLFDREAELAKMLEGKGVKVVAQLGVGEYHAVEINDPSKAKLLYELVKHFVSS